MITRKCGPALAAGMYDGSQASYRHTVFSARVSRARRARGLPSGVASVVAGSSAAIGGEMTSNPIVRKLTFTGLLKLGSC